MDNNPAEDPTLHFPEKYRIDVFGEIFGHELESWFTADIICCDSCLDEFAKTWPGIAVCEAFQSKLIPLTCFYSGSRLSDFYTEAEFLELCRQIECPRCGRSLEYNIWPYNSHFYIPPRFEAEMEELAEITVRTPFLTLRHPLAKRVLDEISKIAPDVLLQSMDCKYFRARPIATEHEIAEFYPPPPAKCVEGRYNHAGRPMLYLASSRRVAWAELGHPDDGVLAASIRLFLPQKILDLASDNLPSELLQAITVAALLSAPAAKEGWEKPEYTFSRFVADCAIDCGFTAIRYPSVAIGGWLGTTGPDDFNLVIFPSERDWRDIVEVSNITKEPSVIEHCYKRAGW